ncbi:MAG TPA: hypothetical protein VF885_25100 [Arthrobacter sp.]
MTGSQRDLPDAEARPFGAVNPGLQAFTPGIFAAAEAAPESRAEQLLYLAEAGIREHLAKLILSDPEVRRELITLHSIEVARRTLEGSDSEEPSTLTLFASGRGDGNTPSEPKFSLRKRFDVARSPDDTGDGKVNQGGGGYSDQTTQTRETSWSFNFGFVSITDKMTVTNTYDTPRPGSADAGSKSAGGSGANKGSSQGGSQSGSKPDGGTPDL